MRPTQGEPQRHAVTSAEAVIDLEVQVGHSGSHHADKIDDPAGAPNPRPRASQVVAHESRRDHLGRNPRQLVLIDRLDQLSASTAQP